MDIDYQTFEAGDFTCLPVLSNGCAASIGFIADHIPRKDSVVVLASGIDAEGQREVAGHILATANEQGIYIHTVNVMENYRRKGIATCMLAKVENLIDEGTANFPISLFTDSDNKAAVLCYIAAGFKITARIPNCRESGEVRLAMQKAHY
jgi:ribosomal protein S18 acetylase RimI-like enzyme|uniref:Acetyltransferase n=1 Tax=Myoviridae sp. ctshb19 TaxID=2825194 RepID=A0A8S5UG74_9CAUD|nr:MAG TPA: acetyltransferase [Myoviridae sp. ctshb19]